MKTLFISDLDGTLLDRQAHLSEETIRILRPMIENGLWFTAATARSLSAVHLLSPLRLKLPCVQLNGVLLYDFVKRDYISSTAIDPQAANAVLSVLRSFGRMAFVYKSDRDYGIHVEFETLSNPVEEAFFEARKNQDYKSFSQVPHITAGEQDQVIYFTMVDAYERLAPICQAVQAIPGVRPTLYSDNYSDLYFLEIFCSSATKAAGMLEIKKRLGADRVVAFGDNLNDIGMLQAADVGIAVGDAAEEVKKCADLIIGASYEDGVARYLEQEWNRGGYFSEA